MRNTVLPKNDAAIIVNALKGKSVSEASSRTLLFLSHATPEDNEFVVWLATQLVNAGYMVWCDVTKLLGGEIFWQDITEAIEDFACRFLFVSTLESNQKDGTLRELKIANNTGKTIGIKDFIVPLKIDAFPYQGTHEYIKDRNFVRFEENRASGLSQLLKLLEREGVPKSPMAGPSCVAEWYSKELDATRRVVLSNESCHSNWFEFSLPRNLRVHRTSLSAEALAAQAELLNFPYRLLGDRLVTFATAAEVTAALSEGVEVRETDKVSTGKFVEDGFKKLEIAGFDAANIVTDLVRLAWEISLRRRGLQSFELASGLKAWFFKKGHLEKDRAYYKHPDGSPGDKKSYRQVVGNKSKKDADGVLVPDGHWHYGMSASPQIIPFPRLVLRHHVIFTDDGEMPWDNSGRMHRARRGVCQNWWNDAWRDRMFAFCSAISDGEGRMPLSVSGSASVSLSTIPMNFISPWTYFEDGRGISDDEDEINLVEFVTDSEEWARDEEHEDE